MAQTQYCPAMYSVTQNVDLIKFHNFYVKNLLMKYVFNEGLGEIIYDSKKCDKRRPSVTDLKRQTNDAMVDLYL
jgi:hypothetical protein